jgi:hypothetical protein
MRRWYYSLCGAEDPQELGEATESGFIGDGKVGLLLNEGVPGGGAQGREGQLAELDFL